ncbi:MAG: hypothetical protein ACOX1H_02970 [Pseudoramibacter sp.]|jgi:hypothetical protein
MSDAEADADVDADASFASRSEALSLRLPEAALMEVLTELLCDSKALASAFDVLWLKAVLVLADADVSIAVDAASLRAAETDAFWLVCPPVIAVLAASVMLLLVMAAEPVLSLLP